MTRYTMTIAAEALEALRASVGPVEPKVTNRVVDLMAQAYSTLDQALFESSHSIRQEPEPRHGSPWSTPDLPADLMAELREAHAALRRVLSHAAVQEMGK